MQVEDKISSNSKENSESQKVSPLNASWSDLLEYSLSFDGVSFFGDASKLRMFANNCLESYLEYGMIKDLEDEELKSVLYYFGKKYESEKSPPVGKELQFLHLVCNKINKA